MQIYSTKYIEFRPVQMARKIPKAGFATESAIYKDVESADTKKSRVTLTAGEDVKGRMTEPDIADHITRLQETLQGNRRDNIRNVAQEGGGGLVITRPSFRRIHRNLGQGRHCHYSRKLC